MDEKEFCGHLEYRICREFSGFEDRRFKGWWCDGVVFDYVMMIRGRSAIVGTVYADSHGQTARRLTMYLPPEMASRESIVWDKLVPLENRTAWLDVSPDRSEVVIDLSRAERIVPASKKHSRSGDTPA